MPTLMAVIERDPESGWFIGRVPQVPGVHSQAPTLEELRPRLQEALQAVVADMLACGEEIPDSEFIGIERIEITREARV
jgi:predicted RNase H-like HicB family nuclease